MFKGSTSQAFLNMYNIYKPPHKITTGRSAKHSLPGPQGKTLIQLKPQNSDKTV